MRQVLAPGTLRQRYCHGTANSAPYDIAAAIGEPEFVDMVEHPWGASAWGRLDTARGLKHTVEIAGSLAQLTADPEDRLASLISTPEFFALRVCNCRVTPWSHADTSCAKIAKGVSLTH